MSAVLLSTTHSKVVHALKPRSQWRLRSRRLVSESGYIVAVSGNYSRPFRRLVANVDEALYAYRHRSIILLERYSHGRSQEFWLEGLRTEAPHRSRDRDAQGVEGKGMGMGCPPPFPQPNRWSAGSIVSSPSGVRGGAPAESGFWYICSLKVHI